jgi:hypothetical protein
MFSISRDNPPTATGEDGEKANEGGNECSALEHVHGSIVTWKRDASRKPTLARRAQAASALDLALIEIVETRHSDARA